MRVSEDTLEGREQKTTHTVWEIMLLYYYGNTLWLYIFTNSCMTESVNKDNTCNKIIDLFSLLHLTLIPLYYIEHQYIATAEKDIFYVKKSRPYHDIPYQISLFSAMITYIKHISFRFVNHQAYQNIFFYKIWLIIFFSMGGDKRFLANLKKHHDSRLINPFMPVAPITA